MKRWVRVVVVVFSLAMMSPGQILADAVSKSTNWGVTEQNIGLGGDVTSASTNYSSGGSTLGDTAVGNSASAGYQTNSGFNTAQEPRLAMIMNTTSVNFGVLDSTTAKTATATFSVLDYTSYGYTVQVIGTGLTYSGHTITNMATDATSAATTEQFGLNLRANTSPGTVGADPVQVPSSSFSYGVAGDGVTGNYATVNNYRFNTGETVASAPKSSGETDYTISFLANIATATPSGAYLANLTFVATGSY